MSRKEKSIVIEPTTGSKIFNIEELVRYKDLLYYMVLRDVTVLYKQTILGFTWAVITPLFQIIIFSVVFGYLAGIKPDVAGMPYPVFSSLAVIPWTYFSNSVSASGSSLINTSSIFTKVYFPRIIIPLTPIFSKFVDFLISIIILIGIMVYFKYLPGTNVVFVLIPLLIIIITASGMGFWLSALAVQYRDFKFAMTFMIPLLMYIAPVTFPATLVLEKFGSTLYHAYALYPMVGAVEGFRTAFAVGKEMPWDIITISFLSSLIIFFTGIWYFRKMEKYFADVA
ncbi:MAG: type transporter [Segetibacter sp.]|nr:type transporter [Segetibacter sp.]